MTQTPPPGSLDGSARTPDRADDNLVLCALADHLASLAPRERALALGQYLRRYPHLAKALALSVAEHTEEEWPRVTGDAVDAQASQSDGRNPPMAYRLVFQETREREGALVEEVLFAREEQHLGLVAEAAAAYDAQSASARPARGLLEAADRRGLNVAHVAAATHTSPGLLRLLDQDPSIVLPRSLTEVLARLLGMTPEQVDPAQKAPPPGASATVGARPRVQVDLYAFAHAVLYAADLRADDRAFWAVRIVNDSMQGRE